MSGFGAPFCTATPIDDVGNIDDAAGDHPAARDQVAGAGYGHDRHVRRLAFGELLFEPQRRPERDGEAIAGCAFEGRRQFLEHRFHRGGA